MPTRAELNEFQQETENLKAVMVAALVAHWMESVEGNPADAVDDLRQFVLDIVAEYGQASAAIAVDFYDSVRPAGSPSFNPVPVVRDDLVGGGSLNWATQPLLTETREQALDRIAAEIQKATYAAAVETLGQATEDDPLDVKYARWPRNPDPCAYCVLRASRGAVYWSESTAERGDHLKCGCEVTPVFPGEPLPYLRKPYMAAYQSGATEAEADVLAAADRKGRQKALLSGMRRANGSR